MYRFQQNVKIVRRAFGVRCVFLNSSLIKKSWFKKLTCNDISQFSNVVSIKSPIGLSVPILITTNSQSGQSCTKVVTAREIDSLSSKSQKYNLALLFCWIKSFRLEVEKTTQSESSRFLDIRDPISLSFPTIKADRIELV